MDIKIDYCYHTHTSRCNHAGITTDREYLKEAKSNGIVRLGFSEHVPFSYLEYYNVLERMHISEVNEYISSINKLKEENLDMDILCGFEAEYEPEKERFLGSLREKVDYMVLGQHHIKGVEPNNNPNYPLEYAAKVCDALDTGLFDYLAHPDIFLKYLDTIKLNADQEQFKENTRIAANMICKKALELNVPLEINLRNIHKFSNNEIERIAYPDILFWLETSKYEGLKVIIGVDAHYQHSFDDMYEDLSKIQNILALVKTKLIENYNLLETRQSNQLLNQLLQSRQYTSNTYETNYINELLKEVLDSIDVKDSELKYSALMDALDSKVELCDTHRIIETNKLLSKMSELDNSSKSIDEKTFLLSKIRKEIDYIGDTSNYRIIMIQQAKELVKKSFEYGKTTNKSILEIATVLEELQTTSNNKKIKELEERLYNLSLQSGDSKQLTRTKPGYHPEEEQDILDNKTGILNKITIPLLITFIFGVGIGIAYAMLRL